MFRAIRLWSPGLLVLLACSAGAAADNAAIAAKARDVLKTHCYRCHGQDGTIEGGINYVLDFKTLAARKKVIPGDAGKSRLFKRMTSDRSPMPPEEEKLRPTKGDLDVIKEWIDTGAPDYQTVAQRPTISEADVVGFIYDDLRALEPTARKHVRYFTITHLYNLGLSEDQLQTYRAGLAKLVNSLSWEPDVAVPRPIDPARTILRVDLRDYKWSADIWQRLLDDYPYGILLRSAAGRGSAALAGADLPHLRADWFVAAASRPPLYHDILQLPKTDRELERQLRVDVEANLRDGRAARAAFNSSGVSRNNRLIERHRTPYGAYWKSYDFAGNTNRQNLFAHPLGPNVTNAFQHDGGEIIFNLPNGLQAYLLVDHAGRRIDEGPTKIVSVKNKPDPTVINGISCMFCHARGIIDKADQVRDHAAKNPGAFTEDDARTIRMLYPPAKDFAALLHKDAERFGKAVAATGGKLGATEPVAALADRFTGEVDLPTAAAELGLQPEALLQGLERHAGLAQRLGALKVEGGTVQRPVFAELFPELVVAHRLGLAHARLTQAITSATEVIRRTPKSAFAYVRRADAYFDKGDNPQAISDYGEALRLDPRNAGAWHNRGMVQASLGYYDLAIGDYTEAIRVDPNNAEVYHNRALAHGQKGAADRAIADLTQALKLDPKNPAIYNDRGYFHAERRAYEPALADFARALELDPAFAGARVRRAGVHVAMKAPDRAAADLTAVLEAYPKNVAVRLQRAGVYQALKKYELALADYAEVIQIDSGHAHAHNDLAWLRATCPEGKVRDGADAVQHARRACALTGHKHADYLDTLAAAYAEVGQFAEATQTMRQALERAGDGQKEAFRRRLELYSAGKPYREP